MRSPALPRLLSHRLLRINPTSRNVSTTSSSSSPPAVIFSGIQPTGIPHLGNYYGALRAWVDLQNTSPASTSLIFSVVDLHAITIPQPPGALQLARTEMLKALLALGLSPDRCTIFEQGAVSAHSELMWILSTITRVGWLERMTQWKAKTGQDGGAGVGVGVGGEKKGGAERERAGLLCYPVLQAADVLVHRATEVPVGEDQSQHLEFTRQCARAFNAQYGKEVFVEPTTLLSPAKRVMSLRAPTKKMSKSDPDPLSRILLTDSASTIATRIRKATTDSIPDITYDHAERPGVANLIEIYCHATRKSDYAAVAEEMNKEGLRMGGLKERVTEAVVEDLRGFREGWERLEREGEGWLEDVRTKGNAKARESAERTLRDVKDVVGLA